MRTNASVRLPSSKISRNPASITLQIRRRTIVNLGRSTIDPRMSRTIPFQRSSQATRARLSKAQLLPIPRAVADELALGAHMSLAALRSGSPDIAPAQHITEAMYLAKFLAEAGHGDFSHDELIRADRTMSAVFDAGRA